jgi:hypothetical protein
MKFFCCFRKKNKLIDDDDDKIRIWDKMDKVNVYVTDEEERVTELTITSANLSTFYTNEEDEYVIAELMDSIVASIEKK